MIVTAVGRDRPGIVGELTASIHSAGGNIVDSRMVNLRGEFAMMILLEASDEAATKLRADLDRAGEKIGLRISVAPQEGQAAAVQGRAYRLKTYSTDQPGIVARVSAVLRDHNVNIEELEAKQQSAPFAGEPLFLTEMALTVPEDVDLDRLTSELADTGRQLNCDIDLDAE